MEWTKDCDRELLIIKSKVIATVGSNFIKEAFYVKRGRKGKILRDDFASMEEAKAWVEKGLQQNKGG